MLKERETPKLMQNKKAYKDFQSFLPPLPLLVLLLWFFIGRKKQKSRVRILLELDPKVSAFYLL